MIKLKNILSEQERSIILGALANNDITSLKRNDSVDYISIHKNLFAKTLKNKIHDKDDIKNILIALEHSLWQMDEYDLKALDYGGTLQDIKNLIEKLKAIKL